MQLRINNINLQIRKVYLLSNTKIIILMIYTAIHLHKEWGQKDSYIGKGIQQIQVAQWLRKTKLKTILKYPLNFKMKNFL